MVRDDRDDPTVLSDEASEAASAVTDRHETGAPADIDPRYEVGDLLGVGGMGEVRRCFDRRVGREVALKIVLAAADGSGRPRRRFLREARVQAMLEHPAIVPLYDLHESASGTVYFTMRRVHGKTLRDVLVSLAADGDPRAARRRMLTAFAAICLAVDYAHARGVVHRDIKPANVMLGEFGEVYVLDWGVARAPGVPEPSDGGSSDPGDAEKLTREGAVVGTPGHMAPEQMRGPQETVDARADVYALGVMLFEMLSLERLHVGDRDRVQASTLAGVDARPSLRAPGLDVPPELDSVCVRATALAPENRFPTARALSEAVERYLDGDRDLERRRALAAAHAARAQEHATRSRNLAGPTAEAERADAMRELGRALAFDPSHADALETLVRMLGEPPDEVPAEVEDEVLRAGEEAARRGAFAGVVGYMLFPAFVPLFLWVGVHDAFAMWATAGAFVLAASLNLGSIYMRHRGVRVRYAILAISSIAFAGTAWVCGPYVALPSFLLGNTMSFLLQPSRVPRALFVVTGCLALVVPALLEWAGIGGAAYAFREGTMLVLPRMVELHDPGVRVILLLAGLVGIVVTSWLASRNADALTAAWRRLHLQAWHLRRMLP